MKWIIGFLIIVSILTFAADCFNLQWLKIFAGSILIVVGLIIYVIAIKNDWHI